MTVLDSLSSGAKDSITCKFRQMPYPEALVAPMREELTRLGVEELKSAAEVDAIFSGQSDESTLLLVVNSVCGCAAAMARPAVALARQAEAPQPDRYVTVFAGQDLEATSQARSYLPGIPPSSPFVALFRGDEPVFILERRHIEGRSASAIGMDLIRAFGAHCGEGDDSQPVDARPASEDGLPDTFRSIL
jgi:putative YphP/YqiW family bacilliredoxin